MASVDVGNRGGEGIPVLKMLEEGELHPLHVETAPIELVADAGKRIRYAVELASELGAFILESLVAVNFSNCCQVVKAAHLFDEGVETSISAGEDGEEPRSCCFGNGVLSIVRLEENVTLQAGR